MKAKTEEKVPILARVPKNVRAFLDAEGKSENRSRSAHVEVILIEYVKGKTCKKTTPDS